MDFRVTKKQRDCLADLLVGLAVIVLSLLRIGHVRSQGVLAASRVLADPRVNTYMMHRIIPWIDHSYCYEPSISVQIHIFD